MLKTRLVRLAFYLLLPVLCMGHARIDPQKKIKPRNNNSGLKQGPCGNVPATTDPAMRVTLIAGETVDLEWEETINHPGYFRIAFSPNGDAQFEANILQANIADNQNGPVNFNDPATYHKYKASIKVPSVLCENCAIQLIQVMTDRNPPTNYYSCADIRIVEAPNTALPSPPTPPLDFKVKVVK